MIKYKLIKKFSASPRLGFIAKFEYMDSHICAEGIPSLLVPDCSNYPEFWTKYMFTTEDGVDMFVGDEGYYIHGSVEGTFKTLLLPVDSNIKYFSTKKAAQEYLSSLKSQFEKDVWYKLNNFNTYILFNSFGLNSGFLCNFGWSNAIHVRKENPSVWKKADTKEVRKLLLEEAKRRYPLNTKIISMHNGCIRSINGKFEYTYSGNIICNHSWSDITVLFHKGNWVKVVEEKKMYHSVNKYWEEVDNSRIPLKSDHYPHTWFDNEKMRDEYIHDYKPIVSRSKIKALFNIQEDEL